MPHDPEYWALSRDMPPMDALLHRKDWKAKNYIPKTHLQLGPGCNLSTSSKRDIWSWKTKESRCQISVAIDWQTHLNRYVDISRTPWPHPLEVSLVMWPYKAGGSALVSALQPFCLLCRQLIPCTISLSLWNRMVSASYTKSWVVCISITTETLKDRRIFFEASSP